MEKPPATQEFSVPISSRQLKPYVTHMSGGRDLTLLNDDGLKGLYACLSQPSAFGQARRLYDAQDARTPLLDRIRRKVPTVFLDLNNKMAFLLDLQDEIERHARQMEELMQDLPADPDDLSDAQKQALTSAFIEQTFNFFAHLAGMISTQHHNLSLDTYHQQQVELSSKLGFTALSLVGDFYNSFEKMVNQLDRILFAEIPAKAEAQTMTMQDISSWKETILETFLEAREKALVLIETR